MSSFESTAAAMTDRVNQDVARMDPAIITLILTNVLPRLLDCWQRRSGSAEARDINVEIAKAYRENPKQVLRDVAYQVKLQARRDGNRINREQATALAQAIIDQAIAPQSEPIIEAMVHELDDETV